MGSLPYAGATKRLERADLDSLGSSWVLEPRVDGAYATAFLDDRGRARSLVTRKGLPFAEDREGIERRRGERSAFSKAAECSH